MTPLDESKTIYKLGNVAFTLRNCDPAFETVVAHLIPTCPQWQTAPNEIREIEMSGVQDLRKLINTVLRLHDGCNWIDAACLRAANGKIVLISGQSGAGKSTTTMALALNHGWKVLAEDLTLIDPATSEIIAFGSPFSLKKGTSELLEQLTGNAPKPILLGEWLDSKHVASTTNVKANLDFALHFCGVTDEVLNCKPISANEYTRAILPYSNISRDKEAPARFSHYLANARCFKLSGGSLQERVQKLLEFCSIE
jgi:hypothetical protein